MTQEGGALSGQDKCKCNLLSSIHLICCDCLVILRNGWKKSFCFYHLLKHVKKLSKLYWDVFFVFSKGEPLVLRYWTEMNFSGTLRLLLIQHISPWTVNSELHVLYYTAVCSLQGVPSSASCSAPWTERVQWQSPDLCSELEELSFSSKTGVPTLVSFF